jgi:hypothetical protein
MVMEKSTMAAAKKATVATVRIRGLARGRE